MSQQVETNGNKVMREVLTVPTQPLTDAQIINSKWLEACESALDRCPAEFIQQFTAIMFLGQGLITESRIVAQIEAHKTALSVLPR